MKDGKHVILYVDDDPDFRDSMRTVLEANGYYFVDAASGEEGLRQFKSGSPGSGDPGPDDGGGRHRHIDGPGPEVGRMRGADLRDQFGG